MTPETYERALELQVQINELLEQKEIWENATDITRESILLLGRGGRMPLKADPEIIPFAPLRASVLAYLEAEITPLQAEFDKL